MALPEPLVVLHGCRGFDLYNGVVFAPLRFCGRKWDLIKKEPNARISHIAFKILESIILVPATLITGAIATIAAIKTPLKYLSLSQHETLVTLPALQKVLRKEERDNDIAKKIEENLTFCLGYACQVEVKNDGRGGIIDPEWHPENLARKITISNPSSSAISRLWATLETQFKNQTPSLHSLYLSLGNNPDAEQLKQLKLILSLYKSVTFSLPADLAYVYAEASA